MADMICPYCGEDCEVCHDDGAAYSEDDLHRHDCICGKSFTFRTVISFDYYPQKADCLNDGSHEWVPTFTFPIKHTKGVCAKCGEERKATDEDMAAAIAHRAVIDGRIAAKTNNTQENDT